MHMVNFKLKVFMQVFVGNGIPLFKLQRRCLQYGILHGSAIHCSYLASIERGCIANGQWRASLSL